VKDGKEEEGTITGRKEPPGSSTTLPGENAKRRENHSNHKINIARLLKCVNAALEFTGLEPGGYFPSLKSLEVNLFIQFSNLNDRWMRKPMPRIRANLYRLHQLMNVKFESEEVVEQLHKFLVSLQYTFSSSFLPGFFNLFPLPT